MQKFLVRQNSSLHFLNKIGIVYCLKVWIMMRLYRLKIINADKELDDLAICYARSKEDAIKKFEELFVVEENQVEEVYFNSKEVAILIGY